MPGVRCHQETSEECVASQGVTQRRELFRRVKSSVVAVALGDPGEAENVGWTTVPTTKLFSIVGTAFLVDASGIYATAAHVLEAMQDAVVTAEKRGARKPDLLMVVAKPGYRDPTDGEWANGFSTHYIRNGQSYRPADLAVFSSAGTSQLPFMQPLQLATTPCEEGDAVGVCGFPHGLTLRADGYPSATFATGVIAGVLPAADVPPELRRGLQLDAMTLGGTSGAPVFDLSSGHAVGIVKSNYAATFRIPVGSVDKAIKVPYAISFAEDIHGMHNVLRSGRALRDGVLLPESETRIIFP
jgi:S1-C subfamily serine protease